MAYIDRDKLIKELSTMYKSPTSSVTLGYDNAIADVVITVHNQPIADVVERSRGKWKICNILDYAQRPTGRKILQCPFCEYLTSFGHLYPFVFDHYNPCF